MVRGALPPEQQRQLVVAALTQFNEPPNHTTHIRAHPAGLPGIWAAAQAGLRLQQPADGTATAAPEASSSSSSSNECGEGGGSGSETAGSSAASIWGPDGSGPTAERLLRKLRWATLGPPYDWTRRLYLRDVPHMPLPPQLRQLAVALAGMAEQLLLQGRDSCSTAVCNATNCPAAGAAAGRLGGEAPQQEQQQQEEEQQCGCQRLATPYSPDAALVNFYYEGKRGGLLLLPLIASTQSSWLAPFILLRTTRATCKPSLPATLPSLPSLPAGDTLNGHVDDAERCLHQPLVSLSLGCPAIFLMGAESKDVPPTALLLRR